MADRIIYRLWEPPVRGVTHTQRVMADASPDASPEIVRRGISMRGGSSMSESLTLWSRLSPLSLAPRSVG